MRGHIGNQDWPGQEDKKAASSRTESPGSTLNIKWEASGRKARRLPSCRVLGPTLIGALVPPRRWSPGDPRCEGTQHNSQKGQDCTAPGSTESRPHPTLEETKVQILGACSQLCTQESPLHQAKLHEARQVTQEANSIKHTLKPM